MTADHLLTLETAVFEESAIRDHVAIAPVDQDDHFLDSFKSLFVLTETLLRPLAPGNVLYRSSGFNHPTLAVAADCAQRKQISNLSVGPYNAVFTLKIEDIGGERLFVCLTTAFAVVWMHGRY